MIILDKWLQIYYNEVSKRYRNVINHLYPFIYKNKEMYYQVRLLKYINTYANIFEENDKYQAIKNKYKKDPYNPQLEREAKEAFKCTMACDYINLLEKSGFMQGAIDFPDFVQSQMNNGVLKEAFQTIKCVSRYTCTREKKYCDCVRKFTPKIKNDGNHKFMNYFKKIHKDIRKELLSYKHLFDADTLKKYRSMLLVYRILFYSFYSSALPKYLPNEVFDICNNAHIDFCNHYNYIDELGMYYRRHFIAKSAIRFNDEVAWELFCFMIKSYKLIG